MTKKVILTGLRSNNDLHIGNYFGALMPIVDMAKNKAGEYQINLFVPDLHSFTTPIDHKNLYEQTIHNIKLFIAAGLPINHEDIFIYRQSFIPAHSELTWILDCFTGFGEMRRMTQFKDKSTSLIIKDGSGSVTFPRTKNGDIDWEKHDDDLTRNAEKSITVGLFNYPVLMASDILLYGATYVPVGDDQTQHLEFTRDIAERINNRFGEILIVPKEVKLQNEFFGNDQGLRIRDLQNPTKKMSKSDESEKGVIFLGDDPNIAANKIKAAATDSIAMIPIKPDYEKQPGVSNLLQILALLNGKTIEETHSIYAGQTQYGPLKQNVANVMKDFLEEFQTKIKNVNETTLQKKLEESEIRMNEIANSTLLKVQKAVGLRLKDA